VVLKYNSPAYVVARSKSPYEYAIDGVPKDQQGQLDWLRGAVWRYRNGGEGDPYARYADVALDSSRVAGSKDVVVPDLSSNVPCQCECSPSCEGCQVTSIRVPNYDAHGRVVAVTPVCTHCVEGWIRRREAEKWVFRVRKVARAASSVAVVSPAAPVTVGVAEAAAALSPLERAAAALRVGDELLE